MTLRGVANALLSSLFEPPCAACAQTLPHPLDGAVCARCWASIAAARPTARSPLARPLRATGGATSQVDWAEAIGLYEGHLRDVIHALKYERRRSIAMPLGRLMRESAEALLQGVDVAVPVPLHPRRERDRGFNQADDLARHLGLPVVPLLRRARFTTSQIELPADARHQNVRDAFALDRLPTPGSRLPAVIVLVDDVSTTGATLEACARVLKQVGVNEVRALTAARVAIGRH